MGIFVKLAMATHQIWSCHVTLASHSENFYFLPNSMLTFRKSYKILGKIGSRTKTLQAKKQKLGWKTPSNAYRVKFA